MERGARWKGEIERGGWGGVRGGTGLKEEKVKLGKLGEKTRGWVGWMTNGGVESENCFLIF